MTTSMDNRGFLDAVDKRKYDAILEELARRVSSSSGETLKRLLTRYHQILLGRNQDQSIQASLDGVSNEEFSKLEHQVDYLSYELS